MVFNIESDVLVIGAGGAGLRAAIEAEAHGSSVSVVSKAPAGMNNATALSSGGFHAVLGNLTEKEYIRDAIELGKGINDRTLVEILAREGGERLLELKRFGVVVHERSGGALVVGPSTMRGLGLTKPLVNYSRSRGIKFIENIIVTRFLMDEGCVKGAVGYDLNNDQPITFSAKAVVLATGGAGALYKRTDCPIRTTGDGYSLAYGAGAKLRDMEFIQFFPLALAEPGISQIILEGPIVEEGSIVNSLGEDIPQKYSIYARPLAQRSRDILSRAIMTEILEGRGVENTVLLKAMEVFNRLNEESWYISSSYKFFRDKLNAGKSPIRVAPVCHFFMGGVVVDEYGFTGVPGLYAAGEVVGGIHGANRRGGNALTDIIVFGARTGASAAKYAQSQVLVPFEPREVAELDHYKIYRARKACARVKPYEIMSKLREIMWLKAGIIRNGYALKEALSDLNKLSKTSSGLYANSAKMMLEALEVPMALNVAIMVIKAALKRTESRGSHYRIDYPKEDDRWLKNIVIQHSTNGKMLLTTS